MVGGVKRTGGFGPTEIVVELQNNKITGVVARMFNVVHVSEACG